MVLQAIYVSYLALSIVSGNVTGSKLEITN